jgi:hypothetical protein
MPNAIQEIGDILREPSRFEGADLTAHGKLFVAADSSFLCQDFQGFVSGDRILICNDGRIRKQLLSQFPPYGGGPCIYGDEETWITGKISEGKLNLPSAWRIVRDEFEVTMGNV